MSHILALDQGTSSSKAIVFDLSGRVLGAAQHEFDMIFPADGWVEQDPEVLWQTTLLAGREGQARLFIVDLDQKRPERMPVEADRNLKIGREAGVTSGRQAQLPLLSRRERQLEARDRQPTP